MAVKYETELYGPVKAYWVRRGYEVKAEVRGCDLVAVRADEPLPVIVEMKKTFTLPLLLQGLERQRTGAVVWLAVERNRVKKGAHNQRFSEIAAMCRRLALGLMTVTFYKTKEPMLEIWNEPPMAAGKADVRAAGIAAESPQAYAAGGRKRGTARLLQEFAARSGDYNVGGSSRRKLVTAYRERSLQCALALTCAGRLAPREIAAMTGIPKAGQTLRDNYYGWFRNVERGIYDLTPGGISALREYREVAAAWAGRFPWAAEWLAAEAASEAASAEQAVAAQELAIVAEADAAASPATLAPIPEKQGESS
ncbi:DUF2161 family putative PD-(D/E)XK-type phosphodiesterase [Cohnella nanjingensis]|uniref:Uncharacterized protein n=1 Tax=Cohnella nanjingensis TaxID=1387779 RepID=A0A7X0RLC3_9BACL|nr:DUF2161 family putative PD-(D/E)XK-type phosphodiesterase [Cohnella nanjingensis]MBB6669644.1 hypothetical protein [Cohnella nanjingensis]